jgi:hypothetical protein
VELGEFRAKIQEFQTLCMRVRTHKRDASHFPSGFFFQREQTFKLDRNISLSEKRLNSILYILVLKRISLLNTKGKMRTTKQRRKLKKKKKCGREPNY